MSTPSIVSTIFCCGQALPVHDCFHTKLHNDPNRDLHEAIFHSFIAFAIRRQTATDFLEILGLKPKSSTPCTPGFDYVPQLQAVPEYTAEAAAEAQRTSPLTPYTPYVIHVTSRQNYGYYYSHRYYVCPPDLEQDWVEMSLLQWFVRGEPFKMRAEKWDLKCEGHGTFFRMTLRPNLAMRGCYPVSAGGSQESEPEGSESWGDVSFGSDS
ncbi:hypothetical protein VTL71DRAFT_476 [Oculimacula yallundae]|uniref:Uncharacterized protein n=1 Tax=Oculimacula yallundae TaxID=86028 RepID=A0ABR4D1N9_9HELO